MHLGRSVLPSGMRVLVVALICLLGIGQAALGRADSWDTAATQLGQTALSGPVLPQALPASMPSTVRPLKQRAANGVQPLNAARIGSAVVSSIDALTDHAADRPKQKLDPAQLSQLYTLTGSNTDGSMVRVQFDPETGTVGTIKLSTARIGGPTASYDLDRAELVASRFLNDQRELLSLSDPNEELRLEEGWMDALGVKHFRYQQMVAGIPVWSQEAAVHLDGEDRVYYFNGRYTPSPKDAPVSMADISVDAAIDAALRHLGLPLSPDGVRSNGLAYLRHQGGLLRLVYHLFLDAAANNRWDYFVDAQNGEVLKRVSKVMSDTVNASGVDLNGVRQNFIAWQEGNLYGLIDPTTPLDDPPYEPLPVKAVGNLYVVDAHRTEGDTLSISASASPTSGWDPAGVSMMASVKATLDYFADTFGRRSLDDNHLSVVAFINWGDSYPNAYWNGRAIVFGSGDGTKFSNLAGSLDTIAHEMQHAVTEFTAGLVYENQSGALNEAYSDITGCMVDRNDWVMGEDITLPAPGYLRDLANPGQSLTPLPSKMSEYQNLPNTEEGDLGGVHVNCLIPAHAAYLMAEGLSEEGLGASIGRDRTEQIFYRALTVGYLLPNAQFLDAREATLQAAEDLYGAGSPAVAAVQASWDAVEVVPGGIGAPDDRTPLPTDPTVGEDLVIYLYPTDGSHDRPFHPDETYDLYAQTLPTPFTGYDQSLDIKLADDLPNYTRPAAITTSDGTLVLFAGRDYNLYAVPADGSSNPYQITDSGIVYSLAASPDGRYLAFTSPYASDNRIYLLDLEDETSDVIVLQSPTTEHPEDGSTDDSTNTNTLLYADALAFDYASKYLVFDALNCISTPDSSCQAGEGYRYWTIGLLDLSDGQLTYPFGEQNPLISLGYPSFAANNNFVIAMDAVDHRNVDTTGEIISETITVNFQTRTIQGVATPNLGTSNREVWGVPSFWGDDRYLTIQRLDQFGGSIFRIPLNADWSGQPSNVESLNDYNAAMPIMHRAGVRSLSADLRASSTSLNFGSLAAGQRATQRLTLTNSGNRDVEIIGMATSRTRTFVHNGVNCLLPHGKQMTITVTYTAGTTAGSESDTLAITSDADTPTLSVSLVGQSLGAGGGPLPDDGDTNPDGDDTSPDDGDTSPDGRGSSSSSGGGGGGCFVHSLQPR